MKASILFLAATLACTALAAGCGDDETNTSGTAGGGATGGGGGIVVPNVPTLGSQIERMGRPAINTATNNTFNGDSTAKGAAKDTWNEADRPGWNGFATDVATSLAILDSLDTNCGNQFLAGAMPVAGRYGALAGVLADDRLWVNLAGDTCTTYLAVEANFTGALDNNDCGGRRLADDTIETSYSLLAAGALSGVDDTIAADPLKTAAEGFPYLAAPQ
jgi:hypothetical protein